MKLIFPSMLCLAVTAGLLAAGCSKQSAPAASQSAPQQYKLLTAAKSSAHLELQYACTIKGQQDVDLYPQVSGTIESILVDDGAEVTKGQRLFVIDPLAYQAAYEKAVANVSNAEATLATKKLNSENQTTLLAQHATSVFAQKSAQNEYHAAEAALALARAEMAAAKNDLDHTEILSPVHGVLGMVKYKVGALVSPNITSPLVSVSDNSRVHAYFSISEGDSIAVGRAIGEFEKDSKQEFKPPRVKLRLSDGSLYDTEGDLDAASGVIDEATGSVTIRATFDNPTGILRAGGAATLLLPIDINDVIVIPQTATFWVQDKAFVYAVENGVAKSRQIRVYPLDDGKSYVVQEGLKEGETIISEGAGLVREGTKVAAAAEGSAK